VFLSLGKVEDEALQYFDNESMRLSSYPSLFFLIMKRHLPISTLR
jgi:hypothetical protein